APWAPGVPPGELGINRRPAAPLSSVAHEGGPHAADLTRLLRGAGAGVARALVPGDDTYRLRVRPGVDLTTLIAYLSATPDVAFAEPNHIRTMMRTPNDPVITQQCALRDIHAYEAWDITTCGGVTSAFLCPRLSRARPAL